MTQDRPIYFYVANLGSEVQRFLSWKEKGDLEAMNNAYQRAIKIIETIKDFKNLSADKEMQIFEKYLTDMVSSEFQLSLRDEFSSYFNPFALRIMKK